MKIMAEKQFESANTVERLFGTASMNLWPILRATTFWMDMRTLSFRMHLSKLRFCISDICPHLPSIITSSGVEESYMALKTIGFATKSASRPSNPGIPARFETSIHTFCGTQSGAGLGNWVSWEVAPAKKNLNRAKSISSFSTIILVHIRKENSNLWTSNSDLHTFTYSEYVKYCIKFCNLVSISSDFSADRIPTRYKFENHPKEYWYIGSILHMSATAKYRVDDLFAIGMYPELATSISLDALSASATFSPISVEVFLESASVLINVSSSRISPEDSDNSFRMVDSIASICFFISEFCTVSLFFSSARSGRSSDTTDSRSCSHSPSCVMAKLRIVTLTAVSGV